MSQPMITSMSGRNLQRLIGCGLAAFTMLSAAPSYAGSGPKGISPSDSHYRDAKDGLKYCVTNFTKCTSARKVSKGYNEWLSALDHADSFLKAAKCNTGGKDARCKEIAALRTKTGQGVNTFFTACLANKSIQWYDIVDTLILAQNHEAFRDAMPKLDAWMARLGKAKGAYWVAEYKKAGGVVKRTKRKGDTVVPGGSRKSKTPKYLYTLKDKKLFLTIYSSKPRKKLKGKVKDDYLRVRVQPNAYYFVNEYKAKAKWRGKVGSIAVPLKTWRAEMAGKKAHVGNWAYVSLEVYHAWVTGKGWRTVGKKRVWGDMWTSAKFSSTTVLIQLR